MKNYERYKKMTSEKYNRRGISYLLMGAPANHFVVPYLTGIHNERILDVGIGYGRWYDDYFLRDNSVTGYDINPELGKELGIEIICGNATELMALNQKYDRVVSFFMTEYLNADELRDFVKGAFSCLKPGGVLGFSIIVDKGVGKLYVSGARIKGIKKYAYDENVIVGILDDTGVHNRSIKLINSIFNRRFAAWIELKNEKEK